MGFAASVVRALTRTMTQLRLASGSHAFDLEIQQCRFSFANLHGINPKWHSHSFYELMFVLDGNCLLDTKERPEILLAKGNFVLIHPNFSHRRYQNSPDMEMFSCTFKPTINLENSDGVFIQEILSQLDTIRIAPATARMSTYVADIKESAYLGHPCLTAVILAYLELFLLEALCQLQPGSRLSALSSRILEPDRQYQLVRQYIEENLSQALTAEAVAQHFHISAKQLNRMLLETSQTSVSGIIRDVRFQKIRTLLIDTDMSLSEIAEDTGFSNEYNMSRFFKEAEGMPPGMYRRSYR